MGVTRRSGSRKATPNPPNARTPRQSEKPTWAKALVRWFSRNRQPLPWRNNPTPYRVWVSEIMLQQTQVPTVIPYYRRFMKRFPSVRKLASANLQDVLKVWEGLGYYSRARNLHKAAKVVAQEFRGRVPRNLDGLRRLSGVGEYTSAAIASIAFDVPSPVLDGNVVRVLSRLRAHNSSRKEILNVLNRAIPVAQPGDFNQGIMELGRVICKPQNPDCPVCPLKRWCKARHEERVEEFPARRKRKKIPHYDVAACVIRKGQKVLISQRRPDQMLGGLWEFPGGKRKTGETIQGTARREIREEIGLNIAAGKRLCSVKHAYSHFKITLHAIDCRVKSGRARAIECAAVKWVSLSQLEDFPFPSGDRKIIEVLQEEQTTNCTNGHEKEKQ